MSRQAEARQHNSEYVRDNTTATNKSVDYVKPEHAMNKHKAGAKPKAKNYRTADSSTTTHTTHASGAAAVDTMGGSALGGRQFCRNCQKEGTFHTVCCGEEVLLRVNEVQ